MSRSSENSMLSWTPVDAARLEDLDTLDAADGILEDLGEARLDHGPRMHRDS